MANIRNVRIVKSPYGTLYLHYRNPDGRRRRLSVGTDPLLAQRRAVQFSDWLLEGKDPEAQLRRAEQTESARKITMRQFFTVFIERHGSMRSPKMRESYRTSFKNISRCPVLIDSELAAIDKKTTLDYMHARVNQDGAARASVNREAAFLKVMLSCAVEWGMLERNPLQGMKLFPEAEKREVELSPEQAQQLLKELPVPIADIAEFAIYSGFRKENILSLRIEDIRFHDIGDTGEVTLTIKGSRREKFPLGPLALEVIRRSAGGRQKGFVFINPVTGNRFVSIHKSFDMAVRKLGFTVNGTKFRFHDLRHVFATWLHAAGVSLDALRPLMGHRDRRTTDFYTTIDRISAGKVLKLMPRIGQKKSPEADRGDSWQELARSM